MTQPNLRRWKRDVLFTLVGAGVAGAAVWAVGEVRLDRARREADAARNIAEHARLEAEQARDEAGKQRQRAEAYFQNILEAADRTVQMLKSITDQKTAPLDMNQL